MRSDTHTTTGLLLLGRRALGLFCLGLGVLGTIMPIIPGWPALILAIVLLGRRDRTLRYTHLLGRRTLRWLRTHPVPHIRFSGRRISGYYVNLRRAVTPHIIAAERTWGI